jgi:hypothetical protein
MTDHGQRRIGAQPDQGPQQPHSADVIKTLSARRRRGWRPVWQRNRRLRWVSAVVGVSLVLWGLSAGSPMTIFGGALVLGALLAAAITVEAQNSSDQIQ